MPLKKEDVERDAQEVVNVWGLNMQAGNAASLTKEFKVLFELACRYQEASKLAQSHRLFDALSEQEAIDELVTRQTFAEAYKSREDKQT
jgi:cell division protein FtsB